MATDEDLITREWLKEVNINDTRIDAVMEELKEQDFLDKELWVGMSDRLVDCGLDLKPGEFRKIWKKLNDGQQATLPLLVYVECRSKQYQLEDVDEFFRRGYSYIDDFFRITLGAECSKFLVYCTRDNTNWPVAAGPVPVNIAKMMQDQGRVVLTDVNLTQRLYRASVTFNQSLARLDGVQTSAVEGLKTLLGGGQIEVQSVHKIVHTFTQGYSRKSEQIPALECLARCVGGDPDRCLRGWKEARQFDGWGELISPVFFPAGAEPQLYEEDHVRELVDAVEDVNELEAQANTDLDGQALLGNAEVTFNDALTRQKNRVCLKTSEGTEFCWIYYLDPADECYAVRLSDTVTKLKRDLNGVPERAFAMAVIVRGDKDFMMVSQGQQNADGRVSAVISPRAPVVSRTGSLVSVLLALIKTCEKAHVPGILNDRKYLGGWVTDFVRAGGQSFIWGFRLGATLTRHVLKVPRSREMFNRIKRFHAAVSSDFSIFMRADLLSEVRPWGIVYPCLKRLENSGRIPEERWIEFAQELIRFHTETGWVHLDVSVSNLYLSDAGAIILGDYGSTQNVSSNETVSYESTPPFFSDDLLRLGNKFAIDCVMMLRCVHVHTYGPESRIKWTVCDEGASSDPHVILGAVSEILTD